MHPTARKTTVSLALATLLAFLLAACGAATPNDDGVFTATLNGANERPTPVVSAATGNATATLSGNTLTVEGSFANLTSEVQAAHVHLVEANEVGGVLFGLEVDASDAGISGTLSGSSTLNDAQMTALENGDLYVNVHSANYPAGEIRGTLVD